MNWFAESFRKVHILYVSPPWARQRGDHFDAGACAAALAEAAVDAVELYGKDHHGVCYYPCSDGLPYPRDVVGELCRAVQARGMRFIAYFSVCFDNYALGVHPEWRATDARGVARRQPPFYWACLSSPYRDYALRQLGELVARYPVDGLWLDIVPFAWDAPQEVWMQTALPAPCYCLSCRAGFEAATGRPLPGPEPTPEERRATYDFLLGGVRDFLVRARALLEAHRPGALLTYNGAGGPGDPLGLGDLVSIEGHAPHYGRQSLIGRWARGLGKPFEILTAGALPSSPGGWNGFDQKPPQVLRVEAALGAAHGGSTVVGMTPYPNGATEAGQYRGFAAAFAPLRPLERAGLQAPAALADAAILLAARPSIAPATWTAALAGAEAAHRALLDRHVQFDLIPDARSLARYRLVVVADQMVLDDAEAEALRGYVAEGGQLLVVGETGTIDGQGRPRPRMALADLLGLEDEGEAGWPFSYLVLGDERLARGITPVPILVNRSPRRVRLRGARPLAELVRPETGRTDATTVLWGNPPPDERVRLPGATLAEVGRGRALYIAVSLAGNATERFWDTRGLENVWLRAVLQNAVELLLPERVLASDAPAGVEIVLNRHGRRLALHVVDTLAADPAHLDVRPQRPRPSGWSVWLDAARVGRLASVTTAEGAAAVWREEAGRYRITLPPMDLHTTLLLDPA